MAEDHNDSKNISSKFSPKEIKSVSKRGLFARLRTYFLTGVVVSAPVGITIWLIWLFVAYVDKTVVPLIPESYNPSDVLGVSVPGIGVVIVILVVTIIGFLVTNFLGRFMVRMGERLVSRVPVVRTIYGCLKQVFDAVLAQSEGAFREVVLIEYPRKEIWVIGFITSNSKGEVERVTPQEMVEDGLKLVISGGIVSPPDKFKGEEASTIEGE